MKVAITADLHLSAEDKHPERWKTFQTFCQEVAASGIQFVIIAGDCFDADSPNYAAFEKVVTSKGNQSIQFIIIPGNHDARLSQSMFTASNIRVIENPEIERLDLISMPILFLPYMPDKSMGEMIAQYHGDLAHGQWILIGHGDWIEGMREPNPLEPGVYMPLTRVDVESYRPLMTVLGHIHKPLDMGSVHYPGSPCPMDINETGKRRYFVLDAETGHLESHHLSAEKLYFNESFVIYPVQNESEWLKKEIEECIKSWQLNAEEKKNTEIRIQIKGYSADKKTLSQTVISALKGFEFYKDEGPDFSQVYHTEDSERAEVADRVAEAIEKMKWVETPDEPLKSDILLQALHTVYGDA